MPSQLDLTGDQIRAFRRRAGGLDERLPRRKGSLRRAAWAGLQDSMPRAALLSINARVAATGPDAWEDPSLVQVWGPRYSAYVVAESDRALFTLGRLPDTPAARQRAFDLAERLQPVLENGPATYVEAGRALREHPNRLRYAATTGTLLMRWDGAKRPVIWTVDAPDVDPFDARLELARRYLHVFGPTTSASFAKWAGIKRGEATAAFDALGPETAPARSPLGDGRILLSDEAALLQDAAPAAPARLLPSGDTYYLLWDNDRSILVEEPDRRAALWTSRVWPGVVLVDGGVVGTWRRSQYQVTIEPWRRLGTVEKESVEEEARGLPIPGIDRPVEVRWED